jgi:hypothetical protein
LSGTTTDGGAAVHLQDGVDILEETELLVARIGPEVLADDSLGFSAEFALLGDIGDAAKLAEGRIGENQVEVLARMAG